MMLNVILARSLLYAGMAPQNKRLKVSVKYGDGKMAITKNAVNHLRAYINFNQIRSHCGKEKGTTFSVRTIPNNKDAEDCGISAMKEMKC